MPLIADCRQAEVALQRISREISVVKWLKLSVGKYLQLNRRYART